MEKQYKLPKEFAEKWIRALSSGEYRQGNQYLFSSIRGDKRYCCLGVACVVSGLKSNQIRYKLLIDEVNFGKGKIPDNIPVELIGNKGFNSLVNELTTQNDIGVPFIEIADWIEKNVEFY